MVTRPEQNNLAAADTARKEQRALMMLKGPIGPTLLRLAAPMAVGIFAVISFMLADTYFVGLLGARPLAAMSFSFPITFVIMSMTIGLGLGALSVVARAIGEGDQAKVRRLTTHSLMLAVLAVMVVAAGSLWSLPFVLAAMGATPEIAALALSYLRPWMMGVGLLVIPMVGNSAIRATGDTKSPAVIMMIAGGVNIALDPILIFGWGPFPRLELAGAAIASVSSWVVTFFAAAWLLVIRERMIEFRGAFRGIWASWRAVLYVGLPSAGTKLLVPLSAAVLTSFVAPYGEQAVAGFGVGTRVEAMALVGASALSTAMAPFAGQNFGAGLLVRLQQAMAYAVKAIVIWGGAGAVLLFAFAAPIAGLFSDVPAVVDITAEYLRVLPISYGCFGIGVVTNSMLTGCGKPVHGAALIGLRLFACVVPLAYIGSLYGGLTGLLWGVSLGNGLTAIAALALNRWFFRSQGKREELPG